MVLDVFSKYAWIEQLKDKKVEIGTETFKKLFKGPIYMVSGTRDNPLPSYPGRGNVSLFLFKIQPTVYIRNTNSSRGARQLEWASCLTSAGRVTLASETTFLNALARLPGAALGVASVT